jgi:thiamine pyrophosphokinase
MNFYDNDGRRQLDKKRCVIITARVESTIAAALRTEDDDFILCADGGWDRAAAEHIKPDAIIGDFDSAGARARVAPGVRVLSFPSEKDDTDTMLALKYGFDAGFSDFVVVGGMSGRFDHSIANLQTAAYCLDRGGRILLVDKSNRATMTDEDEFVLQPAEGFYFSLFSWSEHCTGVDIENAKYSLRNALLTQGFPLGVSNEFKDGPVTIRKETGRLLIILSRKER